MTETKLTKEEVEALESACNLLIDYVLEERSACFRLSKAHRLDMLNSLRSDVQSEESA